MEENGNCHCNQGFTGNLCDEFCTEGTFGIPPNCYGNIFIQSKTVKGTLIVKIVILTNLITFTLKT